LFCAAAVAPIAKYEPESDLFANKNAAHDHYFRTKFWALAGLAVAGGTITLDYILPYVYQMNIYDEILYKARNFFNRAI
jgi:hypothetical protein